MKSPHELIINLVKAREERDLARVGIFLSKDKYAARQEFKVAYKKAGAALREVLRYGKEVGK